MKNEKIKAFELRRQGKSYNEIQKLLKIPKSTLSLWLKNLSISQKVKDENISRAKMKWAANIIAFNQKRASEIRQKSAQLIRQSAQEISPLKNLDLKILGAALYWAEGYNRAKWHAVFCNSDPDMVKLMMRFFREICKVSEDRFRPQVQIHENVSIETSENYWANVTRLPRRLFRKALIAKPKSSKNKRPIHRLPYGTFRIGIADVKVLHKINGWIRGLKEKT